MGDIDRKGDLDANIVDKTNQYSLSINSNGSINVAVSTPVPPAATKVKTGGQVTVTKLGGTNTSGYTIPNGAVFNITSLQFGGYFPSNVTLMALNAKCELWYRPNGTGNVTGQSLVEVVYLCAESYITVTFETGYEVYTGNGTRAIDTVITNWGKDDAEFVRFVRGYY